MLLLAPSAFAANGSSTMPALVRQNGELKQANVSLPDLVSTNSFQGKYFTVVDAESDAPIPFTADATQKLRAATVYYAFSAAREYFLNTLKPLLSTLPPEQQDYLNQPMVIRLNMDHPYSAAIHFDQAETLANGAVTVPASDELKQDSLKPWGAETWFFVAKSTKVPNPAAQIPGVLNNSSFKLSIFESLAQQDVIAALQQASIHNYSSTVFAEDLLVSFALSEIALPIAAKAIQLIPSYIYLDAAMIPEISANEYAHYALMPWLGLKRRFHVGEGYAHYFAGKIMGLMELQDKAGNYSKGYSPIRGDSSEMYSYMNEVGIYAAMSSFTFSVLEDLEKSLGHDGLPVIVGTLPYLGADSNLNIDFTRAVFTSLSDLGFQSGKDTTDESFVVHTVLEKRGF